ncbi:MAG: glutathione S-transferase N-terminal domain-containing protein, partial [Polyangiales bacterium]
MSVYLIGRSSSHFTRIARVFAHELGVAFEFSPVLDLMSRQAGDFAGNPLLRLPILETPEGPWFGTLGICRELARRSPLEAAGVIWPEDLPQRMAANTQELVLQGMATEVSLVMGAAAGTSPNDAYRAKQQDSLQNALDWLEQHAPAVVASLPQTRRISFLEV